MRHLYTREATDEPVEELSLVRLTRAVSAPEHGQTLPIGAVGTVVGVVGGAGYIVEFAEPFAALVDLTADDVAAVPGESRADLAARRLVRRAP